VDRTSAAEALVDSNVIPTLQGNSIGSDSCTGRVQRGFSEFRWYRGLDYSP